MKHTPVSAAGRLMLARVQFRFNYAPVESSSECDHDGQMATTPHRDVSWIWQRSLNETLPTGLGYCKNKTSESMSPEFMEIVPAPDSLAPFLLCKPLD